MVSKDLVARVAALAKLAFTDREMDAFVRQFGEIVAYVDRLKAVDAQTAAGEEENTARRVDLREDRAQQWASGDRVLENAPEREGRLFVVPKVVDKGEAPSSERDG